MDRSLSLKCLNTIGSGKIIHEPNFDIGIDFVADGIGKGLHDSDIPDNCAIHIHGDQDLKLVSFAIMIGVMV